MIVKDLALIGKSVRILSLKLCAFAIASGVWRLSVRNLSQEYQGSICTLRLVWFLALVCNKNFFLMVVVQKDRAMVAGKFCCVYFLFELFRCHHL